MLMRGIAAGLGVLLLAGQAHEARAWAKPADLPSNNQIECPESGDEPLLRKPEAAILPGAGAVGPELTPAIDAVMPAFLEGWLQHTTDALTRPDRSVSLNYLLARLPYLNNLTGAAAVANQNENAAREEKSRELFEIAEVLRRAGQYISAQTFYQRIHVLTPTGQLGRLAIERLQEIEERLRDAAEEQTVPGRDEPEARERDIRNGTMPLGLVQVTY